MSDEREPRDGEATSSDETTSVRVIDRVSAATGRTATELPPLAGVIDPEALNTLCPPDGGGCEVTFRYAGTVVRVKTDGSIRVTVED